MFSFKDVKLKTKLATLAAISVCGVIIVGFAEYFTLQSVRIGGPISNEIWIYRDLHADMVPPEFSVLPLHVTVLHMLSESDPAKLQEEITTFREQKEAFNAAVERWYERLPEGAIRELASGKAVESGREYIEVVEDGIIPALLAGDHKKVAEERNRAVLAAEASAMATNRADRLVREKIVELGHQADHAVMAGLLVVLGISLSVGVAAGALGLAITRGILNSLHRTRCVVEALVVGDLRCSMETSTADEIGEIGAALNRAVHGMAQTMHSISATAEHVASASEQISASAAQQAKSSATQKDQTAQVATALQEMSASVMQVSESSNRAANASRQAAETARAGGAIVDDTLAKMRGIQASVRATAKRIEELGKNSDQIGRIVAVINDIADQTNLLALNAAIEAARAGSQGRGFAVVADEVRKLAERTTVATKEIAQMIEAVQNETRLAVGAMEEGTRQVEQGVETTNKAGYTLKEIIQKSELVGDMIVHIATASIEQSTATEQIHRSMEQIASLVKRSSEGTQQAARACEELSGLALELQGMVSKFKLAEGETPPGTVCNSHTNRGSSGGRPLKALAARAG